MNHVPEEFNTNLALKKGAGTNSAEHPLGHLAIGS